MKKDTLVLGTLSFMLRKQQSSAYYTLKRQKIYTLMKKGNGMESTLQCYHKKSYVSL